MGMAARILLGRMPLLLLLGDGFDLGGEVDKEGSFLLVDQLLLDVVFLENFFYGRFLISTAGLQLAFDPSAESFRGLDGFENHALGVGGQGIKMTQEQEVYFQFLQLFERGKVLVVAGKENRADVEMPVKGSNRLSADQGFQLREVITNGVPGVSGGGDDLDLDSVFQPDFLPVFQDSIQLQTVESHIQVAHLGFHHFLHGLTQALDQLDGIGPLEDVGSRLSGSYLQAGKIPLEKGSGPGVIEMGMSEKEVSQPVGIPKVFSQVLEIERAHDGHPRVEKDRGFPHEKVRRKRRVSQGVEFFGDFTLAFLDHIPPLYIISHPMSRGNS